MVRRGCAYYYDMSHAAASRILKLDPNNDDNMSIVANADVESTFARGLFLEVVDAFTEFSEKILRRN